MFLCIIPSVLFLSVLFHCIFWNGMIGPISLLSEVVLLMRLFSHGFMILVRLFWNIFILISFPVLLTAVTAATYIVVCNSMNDVCSIKCWGRIIESWTSCIYIQINKRKKLPPILGWNSECTFHSSSRTTKFLVISTFSLILCCYGGWKWPESKRFQFKTAISKQNMGYWTFLYLRVMIAVQVYSDDYLQVFDKLVISGELVTAFLRYNQHQLFECVIRFDCSKQ